MTSRQSCERRTLEGIEDMGLFVVGPRCQTLGSAEGQTESIVDETNWLRALVHVGDSVTPFSRSGLPSSGSQLRVEREWERWYSWREGPGHRR